MDTNGAVTLDRPPAPTVTESREAFRTWAETDHRTWVLPSDATLIALGAQPDPV